MSAHADPGAPAKVELPLAVASFPAEAPAAPTMMAPAPAVPGPAAPAVAAPSPVVVAPPAPAQVAPARAYPAPLPPPVPLAPSPYNAVAVAAQPVTLDACPVSHSAMDFATVAIGVLLRDAGSLLAALQAVAAPSDSQQFDHQADMQVRRIAFMRQLAATRDEEDQRAFDEKLSLYLRKRAFLQGLEARQATTPLAPTR